MNDGRDHLTIEPLEPGDRYGDALRAIFRQTPFAREPRIVIADDLALLSQLVEIG